MPTVTFVASDGSTRRVTAVDGVSLMRAAVDSNVPGIVGECGGSLACATCHVHIDAAWSERVGSPGEDEKFMLEFAMDVGPNSRLSCQVVLDTNLDGVVVHVPEAQA